MKDGFQDSLGPIESPREQSMFILKPTKAQLSIPTSQLVDSLHLIHRYWTRLRVENEI